MMKLLLILSILPGILSGTYNARTLPVELRDSLLAVEPADVADYTDRYQLESENEETIFRHSSIADWYVVD
ncbi:MAG: hypothetical protein II540_01890, partial [Paludibacteraceae bacterium]|nr:hypothetical protein [Paludibacteraceae bacterium]